MRALGLPRWTVSFADLALLLLACFILLHARDARQPASNLAEQPLLRASDPPLLEARARDLFEQGEARLTSRARADLLAAAGSVGTTRGLRIESEGRDRAGARFDAWELSAARAAALARLFVEAGFPEERVTIGLPDGGPAKGSGGQRLTVRLTR